MENETQMNQCYHFIMQQFVETGRAPHYIELARALQVTPREGRRLLQQLFSSGVPGWLFPNTDLITSFAPFNNLPTQYLLTIRGEQKWYGQ